MMRNVVTMLISAVVLHMQAQSVSQIKADDSYIYGEGWGEGLISEGTAHEFLTWRRCLQKMAQSLFK